MNHSFCNLLILGGLLGPMTLSLECDWDSRDSLTEQYLSGRTTDTKYKP